MRAIVYDAPLKWREAQVAEPRPGPGEVRLRTVRSGVCGTDVHLHRGEFIGVFPLTPGHEITGVVDAVGDGVEGLAAGELIALDNMMSCGDCRPCRRARPQFCDTLRALGVTEPGGFAEHVLAPAGKCHRVSDLDPDVAVFAEPVACVVHGLDVLQLRPGSDVLLIGTGPTGLILAQLLRASGAGRVTVAGRMPFKLELAAAYGADGTVRLAGDLAADGDALAALAPDGFDVVVDATGSPEMIALGARLLGIGGTLFVYGMADEAARVAVDPYDVFRRELTIKGSFSQAYSFDRAVELLRNGRVRTDGMVTHRFGLGDYAKAIDTVAHDSRCLKAVIEP